MTPERFREEFTDREPMPRDEMYLPGQGLVWAEYVERDETLPRTGGRR